MNAHDRSVKAALPSRTEQELLNALDDAHRELELLRKQQEEKVQKRTQQLEVAKREWEQTFDAIAEPVLLLDRNYQIKRANLALARTAQKDIRTLIGQVCHKELMDRDTPCPDCPLQKTFQEKASQQAEIVHGNGKTIYDLRSFPRSEQLEQVIHTYSDITEKKEYQEILIQSEKISNIGMLAAQVAHEVNNPLAGILSQAQLLLLDIDPDAPNYMYSTLKEIEKAALRCRTIILNLLNFSRQNPMLLREKQSLNKIIEQTLPIYEMMPPRPGPRFNLDLEAGLPSRSLDINKLQSVLLNLLGNAKAATPREESICVKTYSSENHIHLSIQDTGCGMSKELQEQVFKPFFTTKPKGLGTGLGLHIVRQIVEEHDGTITLDSQEGKGSTFLVTLPIKE